MLCSMYASGTYTKLHLLSSRLRADRPLNQDQGRAWNLTSVSTTVGSILNTKCVGPRSSKSWGCFITCCVSRTIWKQVFDESQQHSRNSVVHGFPAETNSWGWHPAVSQMHTKIYVFECRRGGRFYKSSDIIAIDSTTLMRKTTPPPTYILTTPACHPH